MCARSSELVSKESITSRNFSDRFRDFNRPHAAPWLLFLRRADVEQHAVAGANQFVHGKLFGQPHRHAELRDVRHRAEHDAATLREAAAHELLMVHAFEKARRQATAEGLREFEFRLAIQVKIALGNGRVDGLPIRLRRCRDVGATLEAAFDFEGNHTCFDERFDQIISG